MDIITLQEYKDFYRITKSEEDAKISLLISSVSALIQAYLGLDFEGGKTVTETISVDYDTDVIYLDNYPIASITAITELDRYTTDSTVHVPLQYASDYVLNGPDGAIIRKHRPGGFARWPIGPGSVVVSYVTEPTWGMNEDPPADLKLACIELVNYYKNEEYKQSRSIQGTSIVNTPSQGTDFPKHIQVILDRYK